MDSFNLRNITDMIFGAGKEERCADYVKHYGGSRVLMVHAGDSAALALVPRVRRNLEDAGLYCTELDGVSRNPQYELGMKGAELCRAERLDFVVAIGGGSVIDTAKLIAFAAKYEGDPWELYVEQRVEQEKIYSILPVGVISTFAGTGSEMTGSSVICRGEVRRCFTSVQMKPKFCILDPEVTCPVPPFETASGIADMFSNLMENFMSASTESDLADGMITAGLRTVLKHGRVVMSQPENYQSRGELMIVAPMAVYGITNVGRSGDWAVHTLERALPVSWNIPSGAALAVLLPEWMRCVYQDHLDLFVKLAVQVFDIEADVNLENTALAAIAATERFLHEDLSLPRKLSDLSADGAAEEKFRRSCRDIFAGGVQTIGNTHPLTEEDCFNIYMKCR